MRIRINGLEEHVGEEITLGDLCRQRDPEADIVILNGFPMEEKGRTLKEGDEVFFIRRGRVLSEEELERVMVSRHTLEVVEKLKKAIVGIAGAGGLGSHIALALSRIGVGTLVIADFDVVEPSNLNRQHYFIDQLGMPKVKAIKETLARVNPYQKVRIHEERVNPENLEAIFGDCPVLIEAFDRADQKTMLIREALRFQKTVIAASGVAGVGDGDSIIIRKVNDLLYLVGDFEKEAKPGQCLMAPRVMLAAAKQANLAVQLILEGKISVGK